MAEVISQVVQSADPTADETAAALAAAAATAPTNSEEARAQIDAEKAAKTAATERPAWLPAKFKTAEDFAASYAELESKVGAPKTDEADADAAKTGGDRPKEGEGDDKPKIETPKATEVVTKLNENFAANGKLSDEDYALAEAIGHDRATVDAFIAGQQALVEQATQRITSAASGKDSMDRMFAWAKTSMTSAEIDAFNTTMEASDVNAAVIAMEQLKSKYESVNGRDPKLLGGKPNGGDGESYVSWDQVTADMNKPEYRKDAAFRAKVEAKLARSTPR